MPASSRPKHDYEIIHRYSGRIRNLAVEVARCHDLGVPHGTHLEPWSLDYQQKAVEIYIETLPVDYELKLAAAYNACSHLMQTEVVPDCLWDDWALVTTYLQSAAKAVSDHPGIGVITLDDTPDLDAVEETTPALVLFGKLAAMTHPDGTERLRVAAVAVAAHCDAAASARPTDTEIEWIQALADGERVVDLADRLGYSPRSFYRHLNALWNRIDVENPRQAMILAGQKGWL